MRHRLVISPPAAETFEVDLVAATVLGREGADLVIADPAMSRRHARFDVADGHVSVTDLGSTNGTLVGGRAIETPVELKPGDRVRLGDTTIELANPTDSAPTTASPVGAGTTPPASAGSSRSQLQESPRSAIPPTPGSRGEALRAADPAVRELDTPAAVLCFRAGSAGERLAPRYARAVAAARRKLAGLGSEPWGNRPRIWLVDTFADPADRSRLVTEGSVVDAEHDSLWVVASPESPPERPERALALLFAAALPAATDLDLLVEGYGLWCAFAPGELSNLVAALPLHELGAVASVEGEHRDVARAGFVSFLIEREGEATLRQLFASAKPGELEATVQRLYGNTVAGLEEQWRERLRGTGTSGVDTGRFLRFSASYLRPFLRQEAEIFVYLLAGLAFTVMFPFITRSLVDGALPRRDIGAVGRLLALLGGAIVVSLLADLRRTHLSALVSGAVVRDLRNKMFERLQHLPDRWYQQHAQGDVLGRMFSDVGVVQAGMSTVIRDGAFQTLSLVVSGFVMVKLNPLLGVIVLVVAPLVGLIYKTMSGGANQRSLVVQEETSALLAVAAENHDAAPVVKVFGLADREKGRFGAAAQRLLRASRRMSLYNGIFGLSVNLVVTLLRLAVLALGSWLVVHGRLTIGGLVAFLGIMGEAIGPFAALTSLAQQVQASGGALSRVEELLEAPCEPAEGRPIDQVSRDITFEGVTFAYLPEQPALSKVDFRIDAGSRVAFVGPSGSGKSTVLRLLMRLVDPDEGVIRVDGQDLTAVALSDYRAQMGVVLQDSFLFNTTIRENIAMGRPGATQSEIESAARAAEMHEAILALPRGYDTVVGERGSRLSGGQRQRLAIARALVRNPALLLLDEATSALDPLTERQITDTLRSASQGRTTVAVTHRLASVMDYDRIFVVAGGRIAEQGSHEELLALRGRYAQLWAEQTGEPPPLLDPTLARIRAGEILATLTPFAGIDPAPLAAIVEAGEVIEAASGTVLPEPDGNLLVVVAGRGEVGEFTAGTTEVLSEVEAGDVFGARALFEGPSGLELRASQPLQLVRVAGGPLLALRARQSASAPADRPSAVSGPAAGRRVSLRPHDAQRPPTHRRSMALLGDAAAGGDSALADELRRVSRVMVPR